MLLLDQGQKDYCAKQFAQQDLQQVCSLPGHAVFVLLFFYRLSPLLLSISRLFLFSALAWLKTELLTAIFDTFAFIRFGFFAGTNIGGNLTNQIFIRTRNNNRTFFHFKFDSFWGFDFYRETRTVDVHINHIREKLIGSNVHIETVRGTGYKLVGDGDT